MKAIAIEEFGGNDTLKKMNVPTPKPAPDEVQIQIAYAAVNPVDWKIREGYLVERLPHEFPLILGWDASGTVSAVGEEVTKFQPGDEVYAYCRKPAVQWGTYAEYICLPERNVALKPKSLNFAEAASFPLAALTAWQSLFDSAKLQSGETVLIHAGGGGVGGFAIQFAKIAGATVITTASEKHQDYVKQLGADIVIDYHEEDFVEKVREFAPDGIDVVLDTVGGETLQKSFLVLRPGGRLIGIVEGIDSNAAVQHNIEGHFIFVAPNKKELKTIADLIDEGKVVVPTIEEMPLDNAATALEKSKAGHTQGKIVLKIT